MELLVSMVRFILTNEYTEKEHKKYAEFLSKPLELGFFVPCDSDGNVLEEPTEDNFFRYANGVEYYPHEKDSYLKKYQEAKDRVLFDGFELIRENLFIGRVGRVVSGKISYLIRDIEHGMNIEDLVKDNLILTEYTTKQLGL